MNKNMKDFLKCQIGFGVFVAVACTALTAQAEHSVVASVNNTVLSELPVIIEPRPIIESENLVEVIKMKDSEVAEIVSEDIPIVAIHFESVETEVSEDEQVLTLCSEDVETCTRDGRVKVGVSIEEVEFVPEDVVLASYDVPNDIKGCKSYKKTWMDYRKITCPTSYQLALQKSDECYTDPVTGIRMVDDRYCIAVGTYYASVIGTKINLIMENGSVVKCILGDVKADCHTDETNRYQAYDGSVAEMIIDGEVFESTAQYPEALKGNILKIEIIE